MKRRLMLLRARLGAHGQLLGGYVLALASLGARPRHYSKAKKGMEEGEIAWRSLSRPSYRLAQVSETADKPVCFSLPVLRLSSSLSTPAYSS